MVIILYEIVNYYKDLNTTDMKNHNSKSEYKILILLNKFVIGGFKPMTFRL
jgi:hypothetical protein